MLNGKEAIKKMLDELNLNSMMRAHMAEESKKCETESKELEDIQKSEARYRACETELESVLQTILEPTEYALYSRFKNGRYFYTVAHRTEVDWDSINL